MADRRVDFQGHGPPINVFGGTTATYLDVDSGSLWTITGPGSWAPLTVVPPLVLPPPGPPPTPPPVVSAGLVPLLKDQRLDHEGPLDGVPDSYDWAHRGRLGRGNQPQGMTAILPWGQIYSSRNSNTSVRVEVRDLALHIHYRGQPWVTVLRCQPAGAVPFQGGYFRADFGGNQTDPGSSPVTLPDGAIEGHPNPGYNLHFWAANRSSIALDIDGLIVSFDARTVGGVGSFVAGAGIDYWQNLTANFPANGDAVIGRHLLLGPSWRTVTAHTLTDSQIDAGPLPEIVLAGSGPPVTPPPVVPPSTGWRAPVGRPLRIMPVGDSITEMQAQSPAGFASVRARLASTGIASTFVGPLLSGDIGHAGFGAACATDAGGRCVHTSGFHGRGLLENVGAWCRQHTPDVIVLNAGTNDRYVVAPLPDDQIVAAVLATAETAMASAPAAMVLVTALKLEWETRGGDTNRALNAALALAIQARSAAGRNVRFVDVWGLVTLSSDFDAQWSVHPSPAGIAKMAAATADIVRALVASPV